MGPPAELLKKRQENFHGLSRLFAGSGHDVSRVIYPEKGGVFLQLASGRFIPNCFIRLRNVLGGSPKRAAAPSGPSMCHPVKVRVRKMCRRPSSLRSDGGKTVNGETCATTACLSIRKTGS